jgi:hypothetical protein
MLWFYYIIPYIEQALHWMMGALHQGHIWHG